MSDLETRLRALAAEWQERSDDSDKYDIVGLTRHLVYRDVAVELLHELDKK